MEEFNASPKTKHQYSQSIGFMNFVKTATKFIHLIWALLWSLALLSISLSDLSAEPYLAALTLLAIAWIVFALELFANRPWAWHGSFACSVICLFGLLYCIWMDIAFIREEGASAFFNESSPFYLQLFCVFAAIFVIGLLLHTRHQFLGNRKS